MIAVMGASGNVGSRVASLLMDGGREIRVFGRSADRLEATRGRGAEVVVGSAVNLDDMQRLFGDVEAVLIVLPDDVTDPQYASNRSQMSRAITQALRDQRVGHVVLASSIGADRDRGVGPVIVLSLRAAWHMENLLANIPMIQGQKMNGGVAKGDKEVPMIATADIAESAARHLLDSDFTGPTVETILGPEDVSMSEATRALGDALGIPDLPYIEFPAEGMKAALQGVGMSEEFASLLVESQVGINEGLFDVERTVQATTPTRLDEFLSGALTG
jgi:uncharacterized protein YbjT (DUF2867 family)